MEIERNPHIPQELITDKLLKLPVKSLLRFRCVSKPWLSLITSPEFIKAHLRTSANDKEYRVMLNSESDLKECSLRSLLYSPIPEETDVDYPTKTSDSSCSCVGSVNGLVCLAITENSLRRFLYLWNPSIKKAKKLPENNTGGRFSYYWWFYGFGYDEIHDDYKVVVVSDIIPGPAKVVIYNLKSDSWRRIDDFGGGILMNQSGKLVNGKLYWTISTRQHVYKYDGWGIVSFDLASETWQNLELPNVGEGEFELMPGVFGSDLVVLSSDKTGHSSHCDVWVMKDNGGNTCWTKMLVCPFTNHPGRYKSRACYPLFCVSNTGEILHLFRSVFVINNMTDGTIQVGPEFSEVNYGIGIYVESLVNPLNY